MRTHEDQAKEVAPELEKVKRRNDALSGQVAALKNRIQELQNRIKDLREMSEWTDGAAQGNAEVETALAETKQELEKLREALAEKDHEIARLKNAIHALMTK